MTKIYLIRHAEAEGNLYRRIHGHYDSLVTVRGRRQIERLARRFEDISVDRVYSSDLFRARATAQALTKGRGLEIICTPSLREVNMGAWEDRTWGEVERFEPEQLECFNNDPLRWTVEGSEDFRSLQRRMERTLLDIAARNEGSTVAAVSHGSAIRAFLCSVLGLPPHEIRKVRHSDNTAVALLFVDGGRFVLDYHGDNSHLPEELSTFAHQKWWRENTTFDSTNLRFEPLDLDKDASRYVAWRRSAPEAASDEGAAQEELWLRRARENMRRDSRAVSLALLGDEPVGLVELDLENGADEGAGTIEFLYMVPEQRRTGIAVQLLGQAVSVFRSLGREKLRLAVGEHNGQTLGFCEKYGFVRAGELVSGNARHFVMEMDIAVR